MVKICKSARSKEHKYYSELLHQFCSYYMLCWSAVVPPSGGVARLTWARFHLLQASFKRFFKGDFPKSLPWLLHLLLLLLLMPRLKDLKFDDLPTVQKKQNLLRSSSNRNMRWDDSVRFFSKRLTEYDRFFRIDRIEIWDLCPCSGWTSPEWLAQLAQLPCRSGKPPQTSTVEPTVCLCRRNFQLENLWNTSKNSEKLWKTGNNRMNGTNHRKGGR